MQNNWEEQKKIYLIRMNKELSLANYEEAYKIINEGYLKFKEKFGEKDSRTLDLMHLTASRLKDCDRLNDAIDLIYRCLQLRIKNEREKNTSKFAVNDISTIKCANAYIVFNGEREGNAWSKKAYEQLYDYQSKIILENKEYIELYVYENKYSNKNLNSFLELTIMILFNYANRLSYVGERWEALYWMKKCYDDSLKYLGKMNIYTLRAEHNLIDRYINVGDRKSALIQALNCYNDRYERLIKRGFPLKHIYSTKILIIELIAYNIYHSIQIDEELIRKIYNTSIFTNDFLIKLYNNEQSELLLNYLEIMTKLLINDFEIHGERGTYEELHFKSVLAVLFSYQRNEKYIKIANEILNTLDENKKYNVKNVDCIKLFSVIAKEIEYSNFHSYEGMSGIDLAIKVYRISSKYLGKSHGSTLTCLYKIAKLSESNKEEFLKCSNAFFESLPDFVSDSILSNNKDSMIQSMNFISEFFNEYVNYVFEHNDDLMKKTNYIDPLIRFKNLIYDIDLYKSSHNELSKKEYLGSIKEVSLKNVQKILDGNSCVLDVFYLSKNFRLGILIITKEKIDLINIDSNEKSISQLNEHRLIKENIYISLDCNLENDNSKNCLVGKEFYGIKGNISFLSLTKNLLFYKKNVDLSDNNDVDIEVFADPENEIKNFIDVNEDDSNISKFNRLVRNEDENNGNHEKLPFAFLEGLNIKKLFSDNCVLKIKSDANCQSFINHYSSNIIHTAVHGGFLSNKLIDPLEKSRIYLSGRKNYYETKIFTEKYREGYISAKDILNIDFKGTSAVILSGCDTGIGEYIKFQGDYGFRRAFELSGVYTIIACVGPIDDTIAAYFMDMLYTSLKKKNCLYNSFLYAQIKTQKLNVKILKTWILNKYNEILCEISDDAIENEYLIYYKDNMKQLNNINEKEWNENKKEEWKKFIYIGKRI